MNLIIGTGQVGSGLLKVLVGRTLVVARDYKPVLITSKITILHICFPYSKNFTDQVKAYIKLYKPELTIVYSTVPIGTCEGLHAVHSPVEGKHPQIGLSIQNMARWIGSSDEKLLDKAEKFWKKIVPVRRLPSASFTEALKLLSTTEYGINIEFARYKKQVADSVGMDYSATRQWNMDYNSLYTKLGMEWARKYVLDPPAGKKGGHCVTPNAKLLHDQYPSELTKIVGEL